jgi:site-specific DNA recombinase
MHHHTICDLYLRLSLDRDGKTAIERQEADCRAWAERNGLTVRKVHIDRGRSGYKDVSRKGFDDALAAATAGVVGTLVVWKLDRLSRKGIGEVGNALDAISRAGGRLVSVVDGLDTSNDSARLTIAMLAELARSESRNIGVRVSSAKKHLRANGQWIGGQPPFGLLVDPETKQLVHDPENAVYARLIADDALSGIALTPIARMLNEYEIFSPRGGEWNAGTVAQLLRSPAFAGLMPQTEFAEAADETKKFGHRVRVYRDPETGEPVSIGEGIITLAERETILKLIESRTFISDGAVRPQNPGSALLTTLIVCGVENCGRRMHRVGGSYRCMASRAGNRCPGANVLAVPVEGYVADAFQSRLPALEPDDPLVVAIADRWVRKEEPELFARRDAIQAELNEQEAQMADLEDARYVRGEFKGAAAIERYTRLAQRLQRRVDGLSTDLAALPSPAIGVSPLLDGVLLAEAWQAADVDQRRELLRLAIDGVSVSKGERGKRFVPEQRVTIEWASPDEA